MKILTSCNVETLSDSIIISLAHGNILAEANDHDVIVASVFAGSYATQVYPQSLIAGLERKYEISIEKCSRAPAFDVRAGLSTWAIRTKSGSLIVILEFEPGADVFEMLIDLTYAIHALIRKRWITARARVLLPVLGTGAQRRDVSSVAPSLLKVAAQHFSQLNGISEVVIVDLSMERLLEVKHYWDDYLGRPSSTCLSSDLAKSVTNELKEMYERLRIREASHYRWIDELWGLLRDEQINSDTLPAICRQIVESVVADMWRKMKPDRRKRGLADDIEDLKNMGLAQWIIGYLHTLRQFGNYGSHYQGVSKTIPESLSERDLLLCLQCIRSILPVWQQWLQD
jgi:hypothetical protein